MRNFALATLSAVMLLIFGSGTVFAAPPFHDLIHDSGQDDDFCGTGQTVQVTVDGQISWKDDQGFGHLYRTYTANGVTVVETFSGGGKFTWIDDGEGAIRRHVRGGWYGGARLAPNHGLDDFVKNARR